MQRHREPAGPAVFGPAEIDRITAAYDAAIAEIGTEAHPTAAIPAREIRRRLASSVLAAACSGEVDPTRLKEEALDRLAAETGRSTASRR